MPTSWKSVIAVAWTLAFTLAFTEMLLAVVLGKYLPFSVVFAIFGAELALGFSAFVLALWFLHVIPGTALLRTHADVEGIGALLPAFAIGASWLGNLFKAQELTLVWSLWLAGFAAAALAWRFLLRQVLRVPDCGRSFAVARGQLSTLLCALLLIVVHKRFGSAGEEQHRAALAVGFGIASILIAFLASGLGTRSGSSRPPSGTSRTLDVLAGQGTQMLVLAATALSFYDGRTAAPWNDARPAARAAEQQATDRLQRPNLVFISIDTLRADRLHAYGNPRETSPAIDQLASHGSLFERAISTAPWTLPSHSALFTSRYPGDLNDFGVADRPHLAELLRDGGYRTVAFTGGRFVDQRRFGAGFEHFCDDYEEAYSIGFSPVFLQTVVLLRRGLRFKDLALPGFTAINHWRHDSPGVTSCFGGPQRSAAAVARFLREYQDPRPFYLFFHTFVVHEYYLSTAQMRREADRWLPDYQGWLRSGNLRYGSQVPSRAEDLDYLMALYDGCIRIADRAVQHILEALTERGFDRNTLVVLTSDHGESFRPDLKRTWHRNRLHDDLLHVPLIVRFPGKVPTGARCQEQVSSIDVLPTILDLLGLPRLEDARGQSLMPLLENTRSADPFRRYAFSEMAEYTRSGQGSSVRTTTRKYIRSARFGEQFYDLQADRDETTNLRRQAQDPGELRSLLDQFEAAREGGAELSDETREMLETMGYLDETEKGEQDR